MKWHKNLKKIAAALCTVAILAVMAVAITAITAKNPNDPPTIDIVVKQQDDSTYGDITTASEGDVMDYRIVAKLPTIKSKASYLTRFDFADKMDAGLTYNQDSVSISFYGNEDAAKQGTGSAIETWANGSGNFKAAFVSDENSMAVQVTAEGLKAVNSSMSDKYMVVSYKATVSSTANVALEDIGNENNTELTWSRANMKKENIIKSWARVYSYGVAINVNKLYDCEDYIANGQFVLQNKTDGYFITATGSNGVYYVTDSNKGAAEENGTVFSPASDGKFVINGLEADTYSLIDIHSGLWLDLDLPIFLSTPLQNVVWVTGLFVFFAIITAPVTISVICLIYSFVETVKAKKEEG